ncbi:hypothetical protein [Corynebacterium ulcerans]|uniref:hypothetical protein n=1 Tax=Corynebacterium ulcerans TaxID=65058 RepID=UPI0021552D5B|nr:hypothetical protein [Corynebacterium ulcerans]
MFSEFYYVGSGLAPITFTFDASKHPGIKRPSFDNTKYRVSTKEFNNSVPYEFHRTTYKVKGDILVVTSGSRFKQHEKAGVSLLDRDLNEKFFRNLNINEYGATAFDSSTNEFYFVGKDMSKKPFMDNKKELYKVHVDTNTGFGTPIKVQDFDSNISALSYHPKTGTLAVVTLTSVTFIQKGKLDTKKIPEQTQLLKAANFDENSGSNLFGSQYNTNEPYELLPMDDGSFVLNADGKASKKGEKYYGLMVAINPQATSDSIVKILEESGVQEPSLASSAAHTNGTLIARVNKNDHKDYSYAHSLTYNNGTITKVNQPVNTDDVSGWGNLFVTENNLVMSLNGHNGKLEWRNAETFKLEEDMAPIAIPNGSKTYEHIHGPILQLDEGTFYVPSYDPSEGDGEEVFALRKVFDPEFDSQIDRDSHTEKNVETEKTPWWTTVLSVLGALSLVGAILTFVFNFVVKP